MKWILIAVIVLLGAGFAYIYWQNGQIPDPGQRPRQARGHLAVQD